MRRFAIAGRENTVLMSELNITPLIDVMLVLLIMFIVTIPAMTHEVPMDLPQPNPVPLAERTTHRLVLSREGQVSLDGMATSDVGLGGQLARLRADPTAALVMRTDPLTRYERFDQVLAVVKRARITRLGFEGNEAMVR